MQITTHLLASEHGFDDFDVLGLPKVHRVCVGHGIKNGDIFNVYCDDGVKLGGVWRSNLARSLLSFSISHAGYRGLVEGIPTKGEDGRHDWAIGTGCEDGFPVFVDDRQLSYRPTPRAARAYALEIIARCRADGDYRLNDKPSGFLPPPLPQDGDKAPDEVRAERHEGLSVGDYVKARGWVCEWIIESILLSEAGVARHEPFQLCSTDRSEAEGFPTRYGTMAGDDGHVRIWAAAVDISHSDVSDIHPWVPARDHGYAAHKRPWILQRRDQKAWGGFRTLYGKGGITIRFSSEQAAIKRADALNKEGNSNSPADSTDKTGTT